MPTICNCPLPAALTSAGHENCKEFFGQVGMLIFQRLSAAPISIVNAGLLATWDALLLETDNDKIVVSPTVHNFAQEGGDPRTTRGGNASLGGVPIVLGSNPTTCNGEFINVKQSTIKNLSQLSCESNLGVYMVNANGAIAGRKSGANLLPFRIEDNTLLFSDKIMGGYEDVDMNKFTFTFKEGYSQDFEIVALDGDAYSLIK